MPLSTILTSAGVVVNPIAPPLPGQLDELGVSRRFMRSRRIISAGKRWYAFTDHAALTLGGTTTGWTASTVSGYTGMTHDSRGAFTKQRDIVKLVADGTQSGSLLVETPTNLNQTLGSTLIGLVIHVDPSSTWSNLGVSLAFSTTNSFPWGTDYDIGFNSNQLLPGRNFLVFNTAATTHPFGVFKNNGSYDPTVSATNRARLQLQVPTGQTATIYVESLWTGFSVRPAVMIGFDDTGGSHIEDYWMPLLARYGFKGYCAWSHNGAADTSLVNNYDTDHSGQSGYIARMRRWHDNGGHDVINHTLNHTNTSSGGAMVLDDGELYMAVKGCYDLQRRYGLWRGSDIYASSQGQWSVQANALIKAMGFRAQRNGQQKPNIQLTPWGIDQPDNVGWYSLDSPVGGADAKFSTWKAVIDANILYQADTWLGAHVIVPGGTDDGETATGNSLQIYDKTADRLMRYLYELQQAGTIEVMAPSEWASDVAIAEV